MYEHLFKDLEPTEAEAKLIEAAARGGIADFRTGDKDEDDPANAENWGKERNLRAEVIFALLVEGRADWPVHPQGIQVVGAEITGALDLSDAELVFPLTLVRCRLISRVVLFGCRAKSLDFSGSQFLRISGDSLTVTGNFHMRMTFLGEGEVRLLGATIGGNLDCSGATFESEGALALNADSLNVTGNVFLNGCTVKGEVNFMGATVGGDLICSGATLVNGGGDALALERARVTHGLWLNLAEPPDGRINLGHARVGQLVDSPKTWAAAGGLVLDGFEYGSFAGIAPTGWEERLRWLKRQRGSHLKDDFRPQPWEQLIAVMRRMGHDGDARKIAIAKQDALMKVGNRSWLWRGWHGFLGGTIKYGYEPWRAFVWMALIILIGTVFFRDMYRAELIVPAKERVYLDPHYLASNREWLPPEYPDFSPLVYAADVFVPLVDLYQEAHWRPATSKGAKGWAVMIFVWIFILLGWVFTT